MRVSPIVDHYRHQAYAFFNTVNTKSVAFTLKFLVGFVLHFALERLAFKTNMQKRWGKQSWKTRFQATFFHYTLQYIEVKHWGEDAWKIMRFQDICSLFPSPHPKQTAHSVCRKYYAAALERQFSFQDMVNCDQLSSAKLLAAIIKLKLQRASRSLLSNFNQNWPRIFLPISSSEKIGFVLAS